MILKVTARAKIKPMLSKTSIIEVFHVRGLVLSLHKKKKGYTYMLHG